MDYDDDDLYDYGSGDAEAFNEDALDDNEYDQLYDVLPKLKAKLASYNDEIPELDLKEALYYNYYELDAAIEEIKSKHRKSMYISHEHCPNSSQRICRAKCHFLPLSLRLHFFAVL